MYKVVRTVHNKDQNGGRNLAPHWMERGRFMVSGGLEEKEAVELAERYQKSVDTASHPFRYTTFTVEME